jgi:hypothetical protein
MLHNLETFPRHHIIDQLGLDAIRTPPWRTPCTSRKVDSDQANGVARKLFSIKGTDRRKREDVLLTMSLQTQ